ncbi:MAG TPA: acyl-CoA dehydrogenase N-terminal domain-containing protein, partial [Burkholderiaceae bacterium]|nr:acyl-CoA dehydrogenase N-terminal domain-containing protein [Burkholderiaceae bacterium]
MARYTPPLRDMQFVMHEVLDATQILQQMSRHAEIGRELID